MRDITREIPAEERGIFVLRGISIWGIDTETKTSTICTMDEKQALEIYDLWLQEQERMEPCLPIRYMAQKTGLGHGTLQEALKILVKLHKAQPVANGERKERKRYRMLK